MKGEYLLPGETQDILLRDGWQEIEMLETQLKFPLLKQSKLLICHSCEIYL